MILDAFSSNVGGQKWYCRPHFIDETRPCKPGVQRGHSVSEPEAEPRSLASEVIVLSTTQQMPLLQTMGIKIPLSHEAQIRY